MFFRVSDLGREGERVKKAIDGTGRDKVKDLDPSVSPDTLPDPYTAHPRGSVPNEPPPFREWAGHHWPHQALSVSSCLFKTKALGTRCDMSGSIKTGSPAIL